MRVTEKENRKYNRDVIVKEIAVENISELKKDLSLQMKVHACNLVILIN